MRKLDGPTAGKPLINRVDRVSVAAEKVDFGGVHRPLPAGAAQAGARVVHGSVRP